MLVCLFICPFAHLLTFLFIKNNDLVHLSPMATATRGPFSIECVNCSQFNSHRHHFQQLLGAPLEYNVKDGAIVKVVVARRDEDEAADRVCGGGGVGTGSVKVGTS